MMGAMSVRVHGLDEIDPLSVPLPNGTEVASRVERVVDGRVIPHGAVGRVRSTSGDEVEVLVVGVGAVRYARSDLVPRKAGQLRFAMRREAAWQALRPCAVVEATVGSRAWGLADEGSDTDVRGVFAWPFSWSAGLGDAPEDLISLDGSTTLWEIGKTVRQALRADPNTLELLFVESARPLDVVGEWLLAARDAFVSIEIYGTFGRYALSQLKRLEQAQRLAEHRDLILNWLRDDPTLALDAVADRLAVSTGIAGADAGHRAKQYVKQLYRSLHDQGLLAANDFASLIAFAREASAGFELPRELRPKNAYNLIRLISTAVQWMTTGRPELVVRGALRDQLLAIKRGAVPLDEVLRQAEAMTPALEEARRSTALPARPDLRRADELLRRVREELARRFASGAPGPWGVDAPPPPPLDWESQP
jgi:hypothetical protein